MYEHALISQIMSTDSKGFQIQQIVQCIEQMIIQQRINNIKFGMSWLLCCNQAPSTGSGLYPQPVKFKIVRSLNLLNPILNLLVLPKKKQPYKFPRHRLIFLQHQATSHIPIVYFPCQHKDKDKGNQLLLIYCHGSGSSLNNVYNFGGNLMNKYGISVLLYDYTGNGESNRDFNSYEQDVKVVLAWAQHEGYELGRIVLCGFSIGSYSALVVPGPMPRLLISPVCGIIPYIEGTTVQYEGEMFDNIENAQKIEARTLILHGADQMIPYTHAEALVDCFRVKNKPQSIELLKVEGVSHLEMPNVLLNKQAEPIIKNFFNKVVSDFEHKKPNNTAERLTQQLKKIAIKTQIQRTLKNINLTSK